MPKDKKVEEQSTEKKACPLNKKTCQMLNDYTAKIKNFVMLNYKKPIFMAGAAIALLVLLCLAFCCNEQTKLHFSNNGIIKEVISGNSSKYYSCQMDRLKNREDSSKFHISCKKQIIEI